MVPGWYRSRAGVMLLVVSGHGSVGLCRLAHRGVGPDRHRCGRRVVVRCGPACCVRPCRHVGRLQATVTVLLPDTYSSDPRGTVARGDGVHRVGVQTVFVVAIWPFSRFPLERRALVRVPRSRATPAASPHRARSAARAAEIPGPPNSTATLTRSRVAKRWSSRHCSMRVSASARALLPLRSSRSPGTLVAEAAARVLDGLATSIEEGREPDDAAEAWSGVDRLTTRRASASAANDLPAICGLRGRLRAAWDHGTRPDPSGPDADGPAETNRNDRHRGDSSTRPSDTRRARFAAHHRRKPLLLLGRVPACASSGGRRCRRHRDLSIRRRAARLLDVDDDAAGVQAGFP